MTSTNDQTSAEKPDHATAAPGLRQRLEAVLPPWTHWGGGLFGPRTATWTTPAGTWSISIGGLGGGWPALEGPGGTWAFGNRDPDHVIGVLRALEAIPAA